MKQPTTSISPHRLRRVFTGRGMVMVAALTAAWCAMWQTISIANIGAGLVLSIIVLATGVGTPATGGIHIVPLIRLLWVVFVDLVTSTIDVGKEILTPTDTTDEAIVAVEIPRGGRHHFLLLIIAVTLTPGTAVVDADPDTGTLYLHLLHADQSDAVTKHVHLLADLACDALPVRAARPLGSAA